MNIAEEADPLFYKDFDPFYFFKAATVFDAARRKGPEIVARVGDTYLSDHPIQMAMNDEFAESMGVHIHSLRLQAAETLLSLLCGGHPDGPFLRFVNRFRYRHLYEIFDDIHHRRVPARLTMKHRGVPITDFSAWLEYKLFGQFDAMNDDDPATRAGTLTFFSEEAAVCTSRDLINSIKHGCRIDLARSRPLWPTPNREDTGLVSIDRGDRSAGLGEGKSLCPLEIGVRRNCAGHRHAADISRRIAYADHARYSAFEARNRPDTVKINLPDRLEHIKPLAKCVARIKVEFGVFPTGKTAEVYESRISP